MTKQLLFICVLLLIVSATNAQNVNIPDANFKACLVANTLINTNGDTEIQVSEAAVYANNLNCVNMGITDLTGIEAFTNLSISVNLASNPITNLNLSNSPSIQFINCDGCPIDSINLTGLSLLRSAFLQFSNLTSFDASGLPALEGLFLSNAPLTSVTFSNANSNLEVLNISATNITSVNLTQLSALRDLSMQQVDVDQIDLSNSPNLEELQLYQAGLESLDVSNNLVLEKLRFSQAPNLTSLDLSQNMALVDLQVPFSPLLSSLTLASGNNIAITTLNTNGCSALFCVEVDNTIDILNPPATWVLGSGTSLSYDCTLVSPPITITDANFKSCLLSDPAINTNMDNEIQLSEANSFTGTINCASQGITDLTGIEEFINAETMFFTNNLITEFAGPVNTNLEGLYIAQNNLTQLDVSENTGLEFLEIIDNELASIDITVLINLRTLRARTNNLTSLDVTNNTALESLSARNNSLSEIDISQNTLLDNLDLGQNPLAEIDLSNNPLLDRLFLYETLLEELDVSNNLLLDDIYINDNNISELDFSMLPLLISLYCAGNDLDILNIANGFNEDLFYLDATANPNLECIQVDSSIDLNNPPADWVKDVTAMYSYDCMFLGVESLEASQIAIYPNPTSDIITITAEMPIQQVSVFNVQGSLVFQKKENSISLRPLPAGIYFLSLITEHGRIITEKIIKR